MEVYVAAPTILRKITIDGTKESVFFGPGVCHLERVKNPIDFFGPDWLVIWQSENGEFIGMVEEAWQKLAKNKLLFVKIEQET